MSSVLPLCHKDSNLSHLGGWGGDGHIKSIDYQTTGMSFVDQGMAYAELQQGHFF